MKKEKRWLYKKTVIISGANGGIGFNIAKILIEKYDCKIIGIARNKEKTEAAVNLLGDKKANFFYRLFDVKVLENWQNFAEELKKTGVKPDILINNAGFMLPFKKIENISFKDAEDIVKTNFTSYIFAIKTLLPLIKESSSPAVFNMSSSAGLMPVVGEALYVSTKYAVRGLTDTLYEDYRKKVFFGGIYPGFIKTDLFLNMGVSKENMDITDKFSMPAEKAAKKIVKGISRKKRSIVTGADGKFLSFMGRFFPRTGPRLAAKVLKKSNLSLFDGAFKD